MSEQHPFASSEPAPEVLESTSGTARRGPARTGAIAVGAAVVVGAVGVGGWAAYSFLAGGSQPSEALPAGTLAYVSVDLDPSATQKIEALRTLNKFPAFEDEVGIGAEDDLRAKLFEDIGEACEGISWEGDLEPWVGSRAAFAVVDAGEEHPSPVGVVQVTDADRARQGLEALGACGSEEEDFGWHLAGEWAILAETDKVAQKVAGRAGDGTLADDGDYQRWTSAAGDAGIATLYVAPDAGRVLADFIESAGAFGPMSGVASSEGEPGDVGDFCTPDMLDENFTMEDCEAMFQAEADAAVYSSEETSDFTEGEDTFSQLEDFGGFAVTVRFEDGGLEVEAAGDSSMSGIDMKDSEGGPDALLSLPGDTVAALGLNPPAGWTEDYLQELGKSIGDTDDFLGELEQVSGLEMPEDLDTLLGDSIAFSLGAGIDLDKFANSTDGSDIPVAARIEGDATGIEDVLAKARRQEWYAEVAPFVESESDEDTVVLGPNAEYRGAVLEGGELGENEVFQDVVPDAANAASVLFVNLSDRKVAEALSAGDRSFRENLEVVTGIGASARVEDGVARGLLRLETRD